jgi:hypothetical protein
MSHRLHLFRGIRQRGDEPRLTWYTAAAADLYVWQDPSGRVVAFEFCYDKLTDEHVLRWRQGTGFLHARVDAGESVPHYNATPIAVADGAPDLDRIALEFERMAAEVRPGIYRFVLAKLRLNK